MKTKKERLREFILSPATFYRFLRMHGIRLAVFPRPARVRAPVAHPTRKVSIVHLRKFVCVMLHVTGKLYERYSLLHPELGPGAMPLVGWRGEALHGSPAPAGNCLFEKPTASATGSRANGPCKRKSRGLCDRGLFLFFYYSLISRHFLPVSSAETASG